MQAMVVKEHRFNSLELRPKQIFCLECGIALVNPNSERPCGWTPKRSPSAKTLELEAAQIASEPEAPKRGRRGDYDQAPFPAWWNQRKLALAKAGGRVTYATHKTTELYTYRNLTLSASSWAVVTNIPRAVIVHRLEKLGWPINRTLKTRVAYREPK